MRYFSLILLFLMGHISPLIAQKYVDTNDPNEIKSLLGGASDLAGFGQIDFKVGNMADNRTLLVGAQGGVLINRNIILGIGGYGIASENTIRGIIPGDALERNLELNGGYAGVVFGFTLFTKELMHVHVPLLLGAGSLGISDENFFIEQGDSDFIIENSVFYVAEPTIQLEFNITEFFRIGVGASYRYVAGTDLINLSDSDLTGYSGTLSLRLGRF